MDMTLDEYIEFINHLFLQEFTDFDYHFNEDASTVGALAVY